MLIFQIYVQLLIFSIRHILLYIFDGHHWWCELEFAIEYYVPKFDYFRFYG